MAKHQYIPQDKIDGAWIIPDDQVESFLRNPINYNRLIKDCLVDASTSGKTKPRKKVKEEVLAEFTLDLDDPDFFIEEKKKPFLQRDFRTLFRR